MPKQLLRFLLLLILVLPFCLHGQDVGVGIGVTSPLGSPPAYSSYSPGINNNLTAPLFAHGDIDTADSGFSAGTKGPLLYPRQPVLVKCINGKLLAFCEGHESSGATGDSGTSCILMRSSTDKGVTWTSATAIYHETSYSRGVTWINFGSVAVNQSTGKLHLWFTHNENGNAATPAIPAAVGDIKAYYMSSTDHGVTWSAATDKSATVKKQSGTAAPFDSAGTAWGWWIAGPAPGMYLSHGANAGRILIPCDHRYTKDTSGTSWSHVMYSDDDGTNWSISGPLESTVANQNSNEFTIAETGASGDIYGQMRINSTAYRGATKSTDGGVTWSAMIGQNGSNLSFDGSTTTTNLAGTETAGCVVGIPGTDDLYCSIVNDTGARSRVSLFKSSNNGLTWPTSKVLEYKPSAYSALCVVDPTSILASWEAIPHTADIATDGYTPSEIIRAARIPTTYVSDTTARYSYWPINEATSGAISTVGQQVKDYGTLGYHAKGGTGGTYTSTGITTNGSAAGLVLAEKQTSTTLGTGLDVDITESWTLEIADLTNSTAGPKTILDCRNGSGAGFSLTILVGTNLLSFSCSDNASHGVTRSTTAAFNTGVAKDVRVEYNATAHTLAIFLDGTQQGATTSTSAWTGNCLGTQNLTFGSKADGTSAVAVTCSAIRITRGLRTSGFLDGTETEPTLSSLYNYTVTTPATSPSSLSGLQFQALTSFDGGYHTGIDFYGSWDKGLMPLLPGSGLMSFRDITGGLKFAVSGQSRSYWYDTDTTVGGHYRLVAPSNGAHSLLKMTAANSAFDFIQNSGTFTCAMVIQFVSTSSTQIVFDNCTNSASNPGFCITRTSGASSFSVRISDGDGTSEINETYSANFVAGTWYFIGITGSGNGTKLKLYSGAYSSNYTAPTLGAATDSSGTITINGTQPFASTQIPHIGSRSDDASPSDIRIKNLVFYNTALSLGNLQTLATFGSAY